MMESKIRSAKKLLASGVPLRGMAGNLGVSVPTLYRWVPPLTTLNGELDQPIKDVYAGALYILRFVPAGQLICCFHIGCNVWSRYMS